MTNGDADPTENGQEALIVNLDQSWNFVQLARTHGLALFPERRSIRLWDISNRSDSDAGGHIGDGDNDGAFWERWPGVLRTDADVQAATVVDLCVEEVHRLRPSVSDEAPMAIVFVLPGAALQGWPSDAPEAAAADSAPEARRPSIGDRAFFEDFVREINDRNWSAKIYAFVALREAPKSGDYAFEAAIRSGGLSGVFLIDPREDKPGGAVHDRQRHQFLSLHILIDLLTLGDQIRLIRDAARYAQSGAAPQNPPVYELDFELAGAPSAATDFSIHWQEMLSGNLEALGRRLEKSSSDLAFDKKISGIVGRIRTYGDEFFSQAAAQVEVGADGGGLIKMPSDRIHETATTIGNGAPWRAEARIPQIAVTESQAALTELETECKNHLDQAERKAKEAGGAAEDARQKLLDEISGLNVFDCGVDRDASRRARGALNEIEEEILGVRSKIAEYWKIVASSRDAAHEDGAIVGLKWPSKLAFDDAIAAAVAGAARLPRRGHGAMLFGMLGTLALAAMLLPGFTHFEAAFKAAATGGAPAAAFEDAIAVGAIAIVAILALVLAPFHWRRRVAAKHASQAFVRRLKAIDGALDDVSIQLADEIERSLTYASDSTQYAMLRVLETRVQGVYADAQSITRFREKIARQLSKAPRQLADQSAAIEQVLSSKTAEYRHWVPTLLDAIEPPKHASVVFDRLGASESPSIATRVVADDATVRVKNRRGPDG